MLKDGWKILTKDVRHALADYDKTFYKTAKLIEVDRLIGYTW